MNTYKKCHLPSQFGFMTIGEYICCSDIVLNTFTALLNHHLLISLIIIERNIPNLATPYGPNVQSKQAKESC